MPPSHTRLARLLNAYLDEHPERKALPPVYTLCETYRVSSRTAVRALRQLHEQGRISVLHGRPTLRTALGTAHEGAGGAAGRVRQLLAGRIAEGSLRSGELLPKVSALTAEAHCSATALALACRALSDQGLIHKRGRHWIVGQPTDMTEAGSGGTVRTVTSTGSPVVLMVLPELNTLGTLSSNFVFLFPFFNALRTEFDRYGVHLQPVAVLPYDPGAAGSITAGRTLPVLPAGSEATESCIERLGSRYYGAYIPFQDRTLVSDDLLCAFVRMLLRGRRPVIWADETVPTPASRRAVYEAVLGSAADDRRCLHCFYNDDREAVRLVVDTLNARGHHSVGLIDNQSFRHDRQWAACRIRLFEECARARGMELRIEQDRYFVGYADAPAMAAAVQSLANEAQSTPAGRKQCVFDRIPAFRRLLAGGRAGRVSALVALNDDAAHYYYMALLLAGVRVPEDVSMVSFDNAEHMRFHPVSTVDFGLDRYGYLAAHLFAGDIGVRLPGLVNQIGRPVLLDKGSIARVGVRAEQPVIFRRRQSNPPPRPGSAGETGDTRNWGPGRNVDSCRMPRPCHLRQ